MKIFTNSHLAVALTAIILCIGKPIAVQAATFTVTNLNNTGAGSLFAAIDAANSSVGPDTILFAVAGTINSSGLPALSDTTGGTTIDGTSAPTYSGAPVVVLQGPGGGLDGLTIRSSNNEVHGLQIVFFRNGITITPPLATPVATANILARNYIGTDGSVAKPNSTGILLANSLSGIIGTNGDGVDDSLEGNVISGNARHGIDVTNNSSGTVIAGNYIGTDASGTTAVPNGVLGIAVGQNLPLPTSNTLIGTNADGVSDSLERNVISGNGNNGIGMAGSGGVVAGNYIGVDATGINALGNTFNGIQVLSDILIGSNADGINDGIERNIISGNGWNGVRVIKSGLLGGNVTISGNYIGTDVSGTVAIGNGQAGVGIGAGVSIQSFGTTVGGITPASRNVISGNTTEGVRIIESFSTGNVVLGNFIGTDKTGNFPLGNGNSGIYIERAPGVIVGPGNVTSANGRFGIHVSGHDASGAEIVGNFIGTDSTGNLPLGNTDDGVHIRDADQTSIGSSLTGDANIIAFNGGNGVSIIGRSSSPFYGIQNAVLSNSIFENSSLAIDLEADGVTPNDIGDGDISGGNERQNFPVLMTATASALESTIAGSLNSESNTAYRLEFFSTIACDTSGFGEGQIILGSFAVVTDGSGNTSFVVTLPTSVSVGQFITATATDPSNNTSEFSQCVEVAFAPTCVDADGDGFGSPGDLSCPAGGADDCNDFDAGINPGATELCDGIDNDCNGPVDDGIAPVPTTCGVGACAGNTGEETCVGGGLVDSCDPGLGATPEVCDGIDNDCNGPVDDGIAPVPTTCGVGACAGNTGQETCVGGGLVDSCDPGLGATPEVCDGIDNDCNGPVDDGIAPVPTTCGVGACAGNTGEETCVGGGLVDSCDPGLGATPEVCDGIDNDCNGPVDDGIAPVPTTCGVGACAGNTGEETCVGGGLVDSCDPGLGATPEVCDGIDNDCNGPVDDGIAPVPTTCGVGACAGNTGEETCVGGGLVDSCDPGLGATPEVCDGIDNDCNGPVDDGIAPVPTTCGVGACAGNTGEETCVGGGLVDSCDPGLGATPEVCDGIDNDCNGPVDDGIAPVPTTCGVGACAGNTGEETCVGGGLVDSCDPGLGATPEVCDGIDNDCNGPVDDGIAPVPTTCGVGACAGNTGQETCVGGGLVDSCDPGLGATPEVCDGIDNDCNGPVDDGIAPVPTTCGVGACAGNTGEETCVGGGLVDSCDPGLGATPEVCDGIDNDCNGPVDDGIAPVPTTCGVGACAGNTGEETCVGGGLVDSCDPGLGATPEVCDGIDNDCNGPVDDGIAPVPTTCGVGACAGNTGEETCVGGGLVDSCDPGLGATPEVCDGIDNDCNGPVDDGIAPVPTTCGVGACAGNTGEETCVGGGLVDSCDPGLGATPEVCDGIDNDCDGVVDDAASLFVEANKHTVGAGSHPGSSKEPLIGIEICVYDKSEGSCARTLCGGISHQHYECIAAGDGQSGPCDPVACCTADASGQCTMNLPAGDYLVISADVTKTTLPDPLGVSASDLLCGDFMQKHLQQIVRADGKKVPGKTSRRTGSELLVIEPEYVEWSGAQELYPFVFESLGVWNVTTSVAPPEGFVADYNTLSEEVATEIEAVQFTITDVGSDWVPTMARHTVRHRGRREIILSRIGVRLTPEWAHLKGRGRYGHPLDESGNPVAEPGFDPRSEPACEIAGWIEPSAANPAWTIKLSVTSTTEVDLVVSRGRGLVVRSLASGALAPGDYEFTWDGLDDAGEPALPGLYFVTLTSSEIVESLLLRED